MVCEGRAISARDISSSIVAPHASKVARHHHCHVALLIRVVAAREFLQSMKVKLLAPDPMLHVLHVALFPHTCMEDYVPMFSSWADGIE